MKKRVLILGGAGMLGHKLCQLYPPAIRHLDHRPSLRLRPIRRYDLCDPRPDSWAASMPSNFDSVVRALADVKPDAVINCIGIIKQLKAAKDPIISLSINSLFPHRLANLCRAAGARLIHISTDCVFSGRKGMYTEDDVSDAEDLYGRTKYLGEVDAPGCLTVAHLDHRPRTAYHQAG